MIRNSWRFLLLLFFLTSCATAPKENTAKPISHEKKTGVETKLVTDLVKGPKNNEPAEFCYVPPRTASATEFSEIFLPPRTHEPLGLFVGYYLDKEHTEYIHRLLDIAQKFNPPLKINILIPHGEVYPSQGVFEMVLKKPYRDFVNLIPLASQETLWAQDYMKLAFHAKDKQPVILDLPYEERDSDSSPGALAAICKMPLVRQKSEFTSSPGNGDYGGNILAFPGKVVAFGSSMTRDSFLYFREHFNEQKLMRVKTEWLETSHIDEIFNLLPGDGSPCSFSVGYASPHLAMQILNETSSWHKVLPRYQVSIFEDENVERTDYSHCFENSKIDQSDFDCDKLINANEVYEENIQQSLSRLVERLKQTNSCQSIRTVALPQLFAPATSSDTPGTVDDQARAINANTVNNVLLGRNILVSRQRNKHFERNITLTLEKLGIEPVFVLSDLVHHSSGGLHCTTSVIRGFQSQNN